jgi:hypothetical protein
MDGRIVMRKKRKIVHVNQHVIKKNTKDGEDNPVLTVKVGKENVYGHSVEFHGSSETIYSQHNPLSCGARVWIQTYDAITIKDVDGEIVAKYE